MKFKNLLFVIIIFVAQKCYGQSGPYSDLQIIDNRTTYLIPTVILSAINVTTTAIEISRLQNPNKPDKYRSNAIFAIISGSLQTALGVANLSANYDNAYIPASVNIGIGATTIVTSIIRLARKNPPKETKLSYNFFYTPNVDRFASTVGVRLIRRFN
jgi:hypothetical protein